jgi:hypothetical protein
MGNPISIVGEANKGILIVSNSAGHFAETDAITVNPR